MKSEAYLTERLVNLFLVTGELGTFCHSSLPLFEFLKQFLCCTFTSVFTLLKSSSDRSARRRLLHWVVVFRASFLTFDEVLMRSWTNTLETLVAAALALSVFTGALIRRLVGTMSDL